MVVSDPFPPNSPFRRLIDIPALVSASDDKFTYAAVFCALSALVGTTITVGPKILDRLGRSSGETKSVERQEGAPGKEGGPANKR